MREEFLDRFRRFRRRYLWMRGWDLFLEFAFAATAVAGALLLVDRLAFELGFSVPHLSLPRGVILAFAAAFVAAALGTAAILVFRPLPDAWVAWQVDRAMGGEERFLSSLELARRDPEAPFSQALWTETAALARGAEPARVMPRPPLGYRWGIALSLATGAVLLGFPPRAHDAPRADFDASPLRGPAPLPVAFQDASIGAISEFLWDFGDGSDARGEQIVHEYPAPGRYTARLRLRGPGGTSDHTREIEVLPADHVTADFEAEPYKGRAPLEVQFHNLSRNAKTVEWDFGDDATSTDREPVHVYAKPGLYTVRLRARNDIGSDERIRGRYIRAAAGDEPLADFRALPVEGEAPLAVDFEDMSSGPVTGWEWDFGDLAGGGPRTSTDRNPRHVYRIPGRYTVHLRVKGPHGEDEEEKLRYIDVRHPGNPSLAARPQPRRRATPSPSPKGTAVPEGVTPHARGGQLVEKVKVFAQGGGGSGAAPDEVPFGPVFPSYRRAAEDSIERERIPFPVRNALKLYFESIRPR